MEREIDTDRLISLVEARPVLWDKSLAEYKSRYLTTSAWKEVCSGLLEDLEDFEQLSNKEQNDFGKLVYKRWRNVKDNWLKAQRKFYERRRSGSGVKTAKLYLYNEPLSFLKKNLHFRETEDCINADEDTVDPKTEDEDYEVTKTTKESSRTIVQAAIESSRRTVRATNGSSRPTVLPTNESTKRKVFDTVESSVKTMEGGENRHLSFFKGIIPSLEGFSEEETIHFQMGVLSLVQNIRQARSCS
ncbi:uncharacterized protein [Palaemon carinicauda]|uniref:uncharacterized protein n=1 Tax=Palaemon carinicauda TaxID=392227 RepID=UPI0035B58758